MQTFWVLPFEIGVNLDGTCRRKISKCCPKSFNKLGPLTQTIEKVSQYMCQLAQILINLYSVFLKTWP